MDTSEHLTRVRQLATWMRGQRWDDADALLAMASVVGLMGRELGDADALLLLFNRYAAGVSTIVSTTPPAALAEKTTPPPPRPDFGPPAATATTSHSASANFSSTSLEHDIAIRPAPEFPAAEKKFSDET